MGDEADRLQKKETTGDDGRTGSQTEQLEGVDGSWAWSGVDVLDDRLAGWGGVVLGLVELTVLVGTGRRPVWVLGLLGLVELTVLLGLVGGSSGVEDLGAVLQLGGDDGGDGVDGVVAECVGDTGGGQTHGSSSRELHCMMWGVWMCVVCRIEKKICEISCSFLLTRGDKSRSKRYEEQAEQN